MTTPARPRALLSVYDKTGLTEFAALLVNEFNFELVSTGGTARALRDADLPVVLVEQITNFPEMLDGRVKTLHPAVHGGILARRDQPDHLAQLAEVGIAQIDLVAVSLYPFEQTIADPACPFERAIEMIDIGGPCMLRAAAKNHASVLVESGPLNRSRIPDYLRDPEHPDFRSFRAAQAAETFARVSRYDACVAQYLARAAESNPACNDVTPLPSLQVDARHRVATLRYGENPHQRGAVYADTAPGSADATLRLVAPSEHDLPAYDARRSATHADALEPANIRAATALSYNNYLDASHALELCAALTRAQPLPAVCFIKHTNACGAAVHSQLDEAYAQAYLGDPNAAMGGILAINRPIDAEFAERIMRTYDILGAPLKEANHPAAPGGFFVEVLIAPKFAPDAVERIRNLKAWGTRVRLIEVGDFAAPLSDQHDHRRVLGGALIQDLDGGAHDTNAPLDSDWLVATQRGPTEDEWADLRFAWTICAHTKSNAITLARQRRLIGNGAGQMSRVMSSRLAVWLAEANGHADALRGAVAASDAFFPFPDGPEQLANAGITAIIQPGGAKQDVAVIEAADQAGLAMVITGRRHFKH